jgi:hypothetical protein
MTAMERPDGHDYVSQLCSDEVRPYDRIEVWYNDFYRSKSTGKRVNLSKTYGTNKGSFEISADSRETYRCGDTMNRLPGVKQDPEPKDISPQ